MMVLDWDAWIELEGRSGEESDSLQISISTLSGIGKVLLQFYHPSYAVRAAAWLGSLALIVSMISLFATLFS